MEKLNVAIADDNDLMRQLLDTIVQSDEELSVVGTARDGEEAYQMIKEKEPDVVLLDIVMPKLDGLSALIHKFFQNFNELFSHQRVKATCGFVHNQQLCMVGQRQCQ